VLNLIDILLNFAIKFFVPPVGDSFQSWKCPKVN